MAVFAAADRSFALAALRFEILSEVEDERGRVTWLRATPSAEHVAVPAEAYGLEIEETGQVPALRVLNRGARSVLFASSVVLKGGLQTRTVDRSVVVPAGADVLVPVRCVEKGRWAPGADAPPTSFTVGDTLSLSMRTRLSREKSRALEADGVYATKQGTVWSEVDDELTRSGVASVTSSYQACIDATRSRVASARAPRPPVDPRANAALVQPAAGGLLFEAMPSCAALAHAVDKLFLDLQPAPRGCAAPRPAAAVLAAIAVAVLTPISVPPGAAGAAFALEGRATASAPALHGECLFVGGRLAHLVASA